MKMDVLNEQYQYQYEYELSQKNNIYTAVNLPVIGVLAIAGALSVMLTGFDFKGCPVFLTIMFVFYSVISISFLIDSVSKLYSALSQNNEYMRIPTFDQLNSYYDVVIKNNRDFYKDWDLSDSELAVFDKYVFSEYLVKLKADCVDQNFYNNNKRHEDFTLSIRALALAIIAFGLASIFFFSQKLVVDDTIYKISIVKEVKKDLHG